MIAASKSFQKLAENDLSGGEATERVLSSYGVADKSLFIRTASSLYRIQIR